MLFYFGFLYFFKPPFFCFFGESFLIAAVNHSCGSQKGRKPLPLKLKTQALSTISALIPKVTTAVAVY